MTTDEHLNRITDAMFALSGRELAPVMESLNALREQIREMESQQSVVTATLNTDVFIVVEQLRAQNAVLRDQIAELERGVEELQQEYRETLDLACEKIAALTKERDEAETVGSVMGEECRLLRQKYDTLKRQTKEEHTAWKARVAALEGGE